MFTIKQITPGTQFRLADGEEGYIAGIIEDPGDFYSAGARIRLERDWLAGKLSDDEAVRRGLPRQSQTQLKDDPNMCDSTDSFFAYWMNFKLGDTLFTSTNTNRPIIALATIVAIKSNGGDWIENPDQREAP